MILVEKHNITKNHPFYNECDYLCFQSKNVYNQALYNVRQFFFSEKKYLNYDSNYHQTKVQECYSYLPTKVFCQTLKMVDKNFKSFFQLLKRKDINNKLPKYLDKEKGRFVTIFPKQALGLRQFKKDGTLHLSQTDIYIQTKITDFSLIKEVRIVPKNQQYTVEVVYETVEDEKKEDNGKYAAIDLGLNNLMSVTFNVNGLKPFIINGKPLKSINQYYNKRKGELQSRLKGKKQTSNKIKKLTNKRNNKINDYLHKTSRLLVNQLVSNNISKLVIGYNKEWKQDINIGKVNNQKFTMIPHGRLVEIIRYKCLLIGIEVILHEESYTSKCSFFDMEVIGKHENYVGKRMKRGLFRTGQGVFINADINGSYNIMKKAIPNAFVNGIEGLGVNPTVVTVKR